ncbi:MAG: Rieske 2Fe-2S domain-containing protein, partial [Acidobacteria bacterium]|nr:Rieske 2Fe-2S domain-containing protein [Acidobacteriota bacterium]
HLGCTPNWLDSQKKFKCPCHGSGFRSSGVNFEGPAPRPLDRVKISLAADGQLLVDKSIVYRGIAGENPDELYPQSLLTV